MPRVHREAIVAHRASDLYQLVADVRAYPQFVPWCVEGTVLHHQGDEVEARLTFAYRGLRQGFTTRNRLVPDRSITMKLLEGPFQTLEGVWTFEALGPRQCRVCLDCTFTLTVGWLGRWLLPMFETVLGRLVPAFCEQADAVYGRSKR